MLTRQRAPIKPVVLEARPLTRADLACLPQKRQDNGVVAKLRSHHHRIARLDAAGCKDVEICEIAMISHQRLYTLRASPAYVELVASYRVTVDEAFERSQDEFAEASISNMLRAERQIADHFDVADEEGELIPLKTLLAVTSDRADRFGYPKGKVVATINMGSALEKAMVRSGRTITVDAKGTPPALASRGEGRIVDHSGSVPSPQPSLARVSRRGF